MSTMLTRIEEGLIAEAQASVPGGVVSKLDFSKNRRNSLIVSLFSFF